MPRNRRNNGIFDAHGIPKPIIETVQTTARTARSSRTSTHLTLASKQQSKQNGHTLTQSTLLPEQAHGLKYALCQRSDSLEHISAFKKTCKSMARYFEENSVTSFSRAMPINTDEGFFLNLRGRAMFVEPTATYRHQGNGKTYGFIRFEGEKVKFKAESGWGPRQGHDDSLRDNEFLSSLVLQFCNSLGFRLPRHCWDRSETGQYAACHVEKKLIMMLICDAIYDVQTGDIAMFRIEELWERRLKAQIYLDKDPCQGCKNFARELGNATGIQFEMITAKTVVEAEWAKKNGKKHLQPKRTAQTIYSVSNNTRPRKPMDYCIPEISTSRRSTSGGKRKRVLDDDENDDDDDDDDDDENEMSVPKCLLKGRKFHTKIRQVDKSNTTTETNAISYQLGNSIYTHQALKDSFNNTPQSPSPSPQQRSTKANIRPAKLVLSSQAVAIDRHFTAISNSNLPNSHAIPSERSRAIAKLQQAKKSLPSKPIHHNLPMFHCVASSSSTSRKETYTTLNDSTPTSARSSRTVSPEHPTTPTSRTVNTLPTPKTNPSRKLYTESSYSKRANAEEIMTPSKPTKNPYKQAPKSVKSLYSRNLPLPNPISPPRSMQKAYRRTPTKPAVPHNRPSERNTSKRIDLTTPEPSPFLKIEQFQYTPPSTSSKRRSENKVLPIPFQFQ
ncbi:hypothetical protein DSL72_009321 [Monilinia vaccinii-corymbosi]|uniref:Single-strand DNA deaminase toxin A-like C-terminal domain-containing protein n=1 Tax=Monilinia vaccinii-corymbosi TaxID=61207 RepID=A0A8A3PP16_9HELO|nr:hypothetical protein DSL72_009321 [Monilinia vaccinii-corymbosi]